MINIQSTKLVQYKNSVKISHKILKCCTKYIIQAEWDSESFLTIKHLSIKQKGHVRQYLLNATLN